MVIVCDKRRHGPIFCLIGSARLLIDKWLDVNIATLDTGEKLCCQAPTQFCSRHIGPGAAVLRADGGYLRGHVHTLHSATGHGHVRLRRSTGKHHPDGGGRESHRVRVLSRHGD